VNSSVVVVPPAKAPLSRLRVLLVGILVTALAAAGVVSVPSMALAAGDVVTGTVTLPGGALPAEGDVEVVAWLYNQPADDFDDAMISWRSAEVNTDGTFVFPDLTQTGYIFEFNYYGDDKTIARTGAIGHGGAQYPTVEDVFYANNMAYGTTSITYQFASAGHISGTIADYSEESAIAGQNVELYRQVGSEWAPFDSTTSATETETIATGSYAFGTLPAGSYRIVAGGTNGYIAQAYHPTNPASSDVADGLTLEVAAGSNLSNYNLWLTQYGSIGGTVKSGTTALPGSTVSVYDWNDNVEDWELLTSVTTTTGGAYTVGDLVPGVYAVGFEGPTSNYLPEFYRDQPNVVQSTTVQVYDGATTSNINGTLVAASIISGKITGSAGVTLNPEQIRVLACTNLPVEGQNYSQVDCDVAQGTVTAGGNYTIPVPAGKYTVFAEYTGAANARDEYFPDTQYGDKATYFAVKAASTVTGKNLVLDAGGVISGSVSYDGSPLAGATVSANFVDPMGFEPQPYEFSESADATTASDGTYTISGIWPGTYGIRAHDTELVDGGTAAGEWFDNTQVAKDATQFVITKTSAPLTDKNFDLETGGTITGTVVSALNPPLENVNVRAWRFTDPGHSNAAVIVSDDAWTDENGEFTIDGLIPGEYTLEYVTGDQDGLIDGFYGTLGGSIKNATHLSVNGNTQSANGAVSVGGSYTGRVLDSNGDPLAGVSVSSDDYNAYDVAPVTTDSNGEYTIRGFAKSSKGFTLVYNAYGANPSLGTVTLTTPATQFNGSPWELDDVFVEAASSIRGTVVNAAGVAVKNAQISVYTLGLDGQPIYYSSTIADSKGAYVVPGLAQGQYYLSVWAKGFPEQYAGGATDISLVDPTWVYANETIAKVIRLYTGGTISGIVKDAKGKPVKGAWVGWSRVTLDGQPDFQGSSVATNAKGAYVIPGINPGSYEVAYNLGGSGANVSLETLESTVFVGDKGSVKKNVSLRALTKVSGVVTKTGGTLLAGVTVAAHVPGSTTSITATTSSSGAYTLYLPANATYTVRFTDPQNRGAEVINDDVVVAATAISNLNTVLEVHAGSVSAQLTGDYDAGLYGTVYLTRETEDWQVESTYESTGSLQSLFPIGNLVDGDYRIAIDAYDSDAAFGAGWDSAIEFTIADGQAVTLAPIELSEWIDIRVNPRLVGSVPSITGDPRIGEQLTAHTGTWAIGNNAQYTDDYKFQWLRDGKPIPGATQRVYTVAPGDQYSYLRVRVIPVEYTFPNNIYTITGLYGLAEVSPSTDYVQSGQAGTWTTEPSVPTAARVGQTLTVSPGVSSLSGSTFKYVWLRTKNLTTVMVSSSASYKPVAADLGATLSVQLEISKPGYNSAYRQVAIGVVSPAAALKQTKAGKVTITGPDYSVTPGTWSPTGATFTYEWRAWDTDGGYIVGSTTSAWNDIDSESLNKHKTVVVTASKDGYTPTSVELQVQNASNGLQWSNPPVISGINQVGRALTVDLADAVVIPTETAISYQWSVKGKAVKGATKSTFTPTTANSEVTVVVTAARVGYAPAVTLPITAGTTLPSSGPLAGGVTVTGLSDEGNALVGRSLGVTTSGITPTATSFTYQWVRYADSVATVIPKATKSTYLVTAADIGKTIAVRVTAKKAGYTTTTFESDQSNTTITAVPLLTDSSAVSLPATAFVGTRITANPGKWDLAGLTYTYTWWINDRAIAGVTGNTYTPLPQDVGEELSYSVVASKVGFGGSVSQGSLNHVTVQRAAAPVASKAPTFTVAGKAATSVGVGKSLSATTGTWNVAGATLSYQWQYTTDNGANWYYLSFASNSITIDDDIFDAGDRIRVSVFTSKAGYFEGYTISKEIVVK